MTVGLSGYYLKKMGDGVKDSTAKVLESASIQKTRYKVTSIKSNRRCASSFGESFKLLMKGTNIDPKSTDISSS